MAAGFLLSAEKAGRPRRYSANMQSVKKYHFNLCAPCGNTTNRICGKFINSGSMYLGIYTREKKCARQGAVFLQYSLESVVSSERLLEKR